MVVRGSALLLSYPLTVATLPTLRQGWQYPRSRVVFYGAGWKPRTRRHREEPLVTIAPTPPIEPGPTENAERITVTVREAIAQHHAFTLNDQNGVTVGVVYTSDEVATPYEVQMPGRSRMVRSLADAQTFATMQASGQWDAIADGSKPSPFDY